MKYYVIIPAHNEEAYLSNTLDSLLEQSLLPKKVIVVNDNSTDATATILKRYTEKENLFQVIKSSSTSTEHIPGSKVIHAFSKGLEYIDEDYDFIVKLDADLILPNNYFERIANAFSSYTHIGIAGGFVYEQNAQQEWHINHPMDQEHVRGAFKAYSKSCFKAIGGLKPAIGWDTVDELLAAYHGFTTHTDATLHVKHLRPTGRAYNPKAKYLQGQAMYTMRYGFRITLIASLKMSVKQRKCTTFTDNMRGYFQAKKTKRDFLVTKTEGKYIRKLRWSKMKRKLVP